MDEEASDEAFTTDYQLVMMSLQLRIYDVLMALLHEQNQDVANELLELHSTGAFVGSSPAYIGEFLTDKLNNKV